jgi:hypothetical protein
MKMERSVKGFCIILGKSMITTEHVLSLLCADVLRDIHAKECSQSNLLRELVQQHQQIYENHFQETTNSNDSSLERSTE